MDANPFLYHTPEYVRAENEDTYVPFQGENEDTYIPLQEENEDANI
jgi:hypothetical protein